MTFKRKKEKYAGSDNFPASIRICTKHVTTFWSFLAYIRAFLNKLVFNSLYHAYLQKQLWKHHDAFKQ